VYKCTYGDCFNPDTVMEYQLGTVYFHFNSTKCYSSLSHLRDLL